ncbi:MAG TPA: response regulator [Vicinamibacteria bacterium]|nr:response regulator [Vicinamibacteria bacterium]
MLRRSDPADRDAEWVVAAGRSRSSGADPQPRSGLPLDRRHGAPVVLLADDLEDQRELYGQYLEFAGYEVVLARDGYEAIDLALRRRPDVVIMDLAMPGLDGFETTQRLKLLEATRAIPIIALTAHGALPREWALSAGCAAYLKKPCYPHDLALEISSVLAKASGPRPAPVVPLGSGLPARVLVVDGSVGDRELFAEYLEYRGCTVSVSVVPSTAGSDVRRLRPDVIVLDLDLPQVAGWNILRDLRRDPDTRDVPVVGLSRQATEAKRAEARALGAALLAKPCEPDALYLAVSKASAGPVPGRD